MSWPEKPGFWSSEYSSHYFLLQKWAPRRSKRPKSFFPGSKAPFWPHFGDCDEAYPWEGAFPESGLVLQEKVPFNEGIYQWSLWQCWSQWVDASFGCCTVIKYPGWSAGKGTRKENFNVQQAGTGRWWMVLKWCKSQMTSFEEPVTFLIAMQKKKCKRKKITDVMDQNAHFLVKVLHQLVLFIADLSFSSLKT